MRISGLTGKDRRMSTPEHVPKITHPKNSCSANVKRERALAKASHRTTEECLDLDASLIARSAEVLSLLQPPLAQTYGIQSQIVSLRQSISAHALKAEYMLAWFQAEAPEIVILYR